MKKHYEQIVRDSVSRVERSLRVQVMDPNDPAYGAFRNPEYVTEPKWTIYRLTTMCAVYLNRDTGFYHDSALFERIMLGFAYIVRMQREDGTFDLVNCNFHAAPDTAFCVKRLMPLFRYLEAHRFDDQTETLYETVRGIIKRGAEGMARGGFHTPNHRWAIASNLMECFDIFGEERWRARAQEYLAEGIDNNEYGEYAERSAGNYNRVNNDAMITLAKRTGDHQYYEYAVKNLRMMLNYIEPDGTMFTNNSTRQDRGVKVLPRNYYLEYLEMGDMFGIPEFLDMANFIIDSALAHGHRTPDVLMHLMAEPHLIDIEHEGCGVPAQYQQFYAESGIARMRRGDWSYSVVEGCPGFFYFQRGALACGLKIGVGFFEHRAFQGGALRRTENGYILEQTMHGWYYEPNGKAGDTTDWWKMDNAARAKQAGPDLHLCVEIVEQEDGVDLTVTADGIDRALPRFEIAFDAPCTVEGDGFFLQGEPGKQMIAKSGMVKVSRGGDCIEVGPAFAGHHYVGGKFGSAAPSGTHFTVYFTDTTCFARTISFRARPADY